MFRVKEIRMENGMTRAQLARTLNLNQGTLANYENETREASYEMLCLFSRFFDVSIDYLLGKDADDSIKAPPKPFSAKEKTLISDFRVLSDSRQRLMLSIVKLLKEQQEQENGDANDTIKKFD